MRTNRKRSVAVSAAALLVLVGVLYWQGYRHAYPYGPRPAALPIIVNALRVYALDHGQSFPNANWDAYPSLELLHPNYLSAGYLAGLSKDRAETERELLNGGHLTASNCSLVYFPGLHATDDPSIALIWERQTGIGFNGRSRPGRAVGFVSGEVNQVPDAQWEQFLTRQSLLRESASQSRTNSPPSSRK